MKLPVYLFLAGLVLLSACVPGPPPQSITGDPLVRLTDIDETGLFAAEPGGRKVAISRGGLSLFDLESNSSQKLSPQKPVALAWSPDGLELAAAYSNSDHETGLLVYSAEGALVRESLLPVSLTGLLWSARGDLIATGFALKVYSFGANLRQALYIIDGDDVEEVPLSDSTLRPSLASAIASQLRAVQPVSFSPFGDEMVFLFLHDPPEFPPYLQLFYQNWQSDEQRPLQRMPLQTTGVSWDPSDDLVYIQSGNRLESLRLWPPIDAASEVSSHEEPRFVNGRLYKGQDLLADWGEGAQLQFLADGGFLLAVGNALYLGGGAPKVKRSDYNEKEWNLRLWRYDGLIDQSEYLELLKEKDP